jgi:hypothetical protein
MGFLSKIFGSKVKVPEFKEIDPDVEVQKAFDSIQEQLPQAQRISRNIAEADTDTTLAVLEKIAPGTRDIIQQQVANLQAGLRGELPADVQRAITDRAAARSVQGGFGGSQFARNLELRDLGLTSLQRIDTAMGQSAQALSQYASMTPRSSVGSMFLTPQARLTFAQGERNQQFQRDMAAAQERAKADPVARGLFDAGVAIAGSAVGASVGGFSGAQMGGSAGSVGAGPQPFSTSDFRVTPDSYQYPGSSQSKPGFWGQFGKNLSSLMMQGE